MRRVYFWALWGISALAWLIAIAHLAPSMNGIDGFYFRDAGWNLAAYGKFESAGLVFMRDLTPRFYSHYTPLMPLLFAAYAGIFPRNEYAGTIFNFLVALFADGVGLFLVLRQPPGRLRTIAALSLALLPAVLVTNDRPEALGLAFGGLTLAVAAARRPRPILTGLMIALCFMAHPFTAVLAGVWVAAFWFSRSGPEEQGRQRALRRLILTGSVCLVAIAVVALVYYAIDRTSLSRFLAHVQGSDRGVGWINAIKSRGMLLHEQLGLRSGPVEMERHVFSLCGFAALAGWAWVRRKRLDARTWPFVAAGLACPLMALGFFPAEPGYVVLIGLLVPYGLLAANGISGKLTNPALGLLLFEMLINSPAAAINVVQQFEQLPSYRLARAQPSYLLSQLKSPDAIVAVEYGSYDLFKPTFRHLIYVRNAVDDAHYKSLAAIANCYAGFHGAAGEVRPLPPELNPAEYRVIQPAPAHLWITIFGHRVMSGQWGYGCDLYLHTEGGRQ